MASEEAKFLTADKASVENLKEELQQSTLCLMGYEGYTVSGGEQMASSGCGETYGRWRNGVTGKRPNCLRVRSVGLLGRHYVKMCV